MLETEEVKSGVRENNWKNSETKSQRFVIIFDFFSSRSESGGKIAVVLAPTAAAAAVTSEASGQSKVCFRASSICLI